MRIAVPKGTPVIWVGHDEDEVLLDRGQPLVLVGKRQTARGMEVQMLALPKELSP